MLNRIEVLSRLLDVAVEYYSGEKSVPINNIITLIEDISLPSLYEIDLSELPAPKDAYCPHDFKNEIDKKIWHYQQEFFYEILGCVDFLADDELSKEDREKRKNQCIDALINWEESLQKYARGFRKQNFKIL